MYLTLNLPIKLAIYNIYLIVPSYRHGKLKESRIEHQLFIVLTIILIIIVTNANSISTKDNVKLHVINSSGKNACIQCQWMLTRNLGFSQSTVMYVESYKLYSHITGNNIKQKYNLYVSFTLEAISELKDVTNYMHCGIISLQI